MLKIVYAANNTLNSRIQLNRFLNAVKDKPYIIKVAAYKQSSPHINIDWTLNCLHNIFDKDKSYLDNEYFINYYNHIKYFAPDLIISDLEYFTSVIANNLDITLWQCSSSMLNYGLTWAEKYNVSLYSQYSFLLNRRSNQKYVNILDNSNLNLVYSHFGDTKIPPTLKDNFEWIRPYHYLGHKSIPCQHNVVAALLSNNKKIYHNLNKVNDSVVFSSFTLEKYLNLTIKDIDNEAEYACNLKNCNLFLCEGQTSFMADAFYNNKFTAVMPNLHDAECIINSMYSEKLNLSKNIYENLDLNDLKCSNIEYVLNDKVEYLHERLDKI
jgi:uncharacterized protein (TIGR00661 family)